MFVFFSKFLLTCCQSEEVYKLKGQMGNFIVSQQANYIFNSYFYNIVVSLYYTASFIIRLRISSALFSTRFIIRS